MFSFVQAITLTKFGSDFQRSKNSSKNGIYEHTWHYMYVTYTYNDAILLSIQLNFLSDIHVNIYSLSLQQCFSPSMQMPVKSNSFTPSPSPSPTRKSFMRWFSFTFSLFSFFQVKINDIQFLWNHFIKYQMLSHSFNYYIDLENTVYLVLNFFFNFDLIDENCVIPLFRHCFEINTCTPLVPHFILKIFALETEGYFFGLNYWL